MSHAISGKHKSTGSDLDVNLKDPSLARSFLILYLFETIEKILQLRLFINSEEHRRSRKKWPVISEFEDMLKHLIGQLDATVIPNFCELFQGDSVDLDRIAYTAACIREVIQILTELHNRLHLLAGQGRGENEIAYDFVQKLVYDNLGDLPWESSWLPSMPAMTLTDDFDFVDYTLQDIFSTALADHHLEELPLWEREDVIALPKVEVDNPLMWAVLAHEVAHIVIDHAHLLDAIIINSEAYKEFPSGRVTYKKHSREICADLMAIRLLGPSYFISFASMTLLVAEPYKQPRQPTHPSNAERFRAMEKAIVRHGLRFAIIAEDLLSETHSFAVPFGKDLLTLFFDVNRYKHKLWTDPAYSKLFVPADFLRNKREGTVIIPPESDLIENILDLVYVPVSRLETWEEISYVAKLLDLGRPVSSHAPALDSKKLQRALNQMGSEGTQSKFYEVLLTPETPLSLATLLMSGWLKKVYIDYVRLLKAIIKPDKAGTTLWNIVESYQHTLSQRNELLQVSLSNALMMQIYQQWRESHDE